MSSGSENSAEINKWLHRLRDGDASARQELIHSAQNRLIRLARKMLSDFPRLRRWEETDDVFQNAVIRLCRSLDHVIPDSASALISLAARDTRCALIDLARHYYGPQGLGANHHSAGDSSSLLPAADPPDDTHEPTSLAYWSEFHQRVQELPAEQQQVMDLVWYHGLGQAEAADLLNISERTLRTVAITARVVHTALKIARIAPVQMTAECGRATEFEFRQRALHLADSLPRI